MRSQFSPLSLEAVAGVGAIKSEALPDLVDQVDVRPDKMARQETEVPGVPGVAEALNQLAELPGHAWSAGHLEQRVHHFSVGTVVLVPTQAVEVGLVETLGEVADTVLEWQRVQEVVEAVPLLAEIAIVLRLTAPQERLGL